MQIKPEQLSAHMKRGVAPVYVVSGDEPLQKDELLNVIRQSARDAGFTERVVLHTDTHFDWELINQYADSPSLFAEKRLLDVRIPSRSPGQQGANALIRYASRPSEDQVMLLITGQLDAKQRRSKWYQSLDRVGVTVSVWALDTWNLPRWIRARIAHRGVTITDEALEVLAERVEGNLLACAQELQKLILLCQGQSIQVQDVLQSVADNPHFDAFGLVDSTLAGDAQRTTRILLGLAKEGMDPLPVLGILVWEIREIVGIANELVNGGNFEQIINRRPMTWRRRGKTIMLALNRQKRTAWLEMLGVAGCVDEIIKGSRKGNAWEALLGLALLITGTKIPFPDAGSDKTRLGVCPT